MKRPAVTLAFHRRGPEFLAAVFGLGWFFAIGGYRALPPTALDWLGGSDWTQHLMGWLFLRRSPWTLPLGRVEGLAWPGGTTVGFTDSNPLVALPLRLASPLLPQDFQYIGAWLGACFALQGWAGARLAAVGSERAVDRLLGGILFALSPALLARLGHDTLCAHFALLLLLALHLRPVNGPLAGRRMLRRALAATTLLAAVHPYLCAMSLALSLALVAKLWRVDRLVGGREARRWAGALLLAPLAILGLLGYLTAAPSHGTGFGIFSTDLLAFVNPFGASSLLPDLHSESGQWEGNAYLGAGGVFLAAVATSLALRAPPRPGRLRAVAPVAAVSLLLAAFALSSTVRAAGREVLDLGWLYRSLAGVVGPFRSSGRFVWPLYYLVLALAVVLPLRRLRLRPRLATALLAGAVLLQLADLAPRAVGAHFQPRPWRPRDPAWQHAAGHYRSPRAGAAAGGRPRRGGRGVPGDGLRCHRGVGAARLRGVRPGNDREQWLPRARARTGDGAALRRAPSRGG